MISRKAVSPIIATVLLVVIALILVGLLLSWGQNFVQRSTSDADTAIDRKCIGADITITNCDYNGEGEKGTIGFIIINSGKVDFRADENINLILIDDDGNLVNDKLDILNEYNVAEPEDRQAFRRGESAQIFVEDYDATTPVTVEIRSTQCFNYFSRTTCN